MTTSPDDQAASALVREGWGHLRFHRPLAAWACWQRALRLWPGQPAAREALRQLADTPELPATARREYRFRTPADDARRRRWDDAFIGRDLSDLDAAASVFAGLAADDPLDADAVYNLALCLAWLGRNAESIEPLDRVVQLTAGTDFAHAVNAWKLAEILRQGAGAEAHAQDFNHVVDLTGSGDPDQIHEALARCVVLRRLPAPVDPAVDPTHRGVTVDEWLDRTMPEPHEGELRLDAVPRVLAIVFASDRVFRLSLPSIEGLARVIDVLDSLGIEPDSTIRTPLPLALLDAAIWTIRLPDWVDDQDRRRLYRETVEDYYENRWINIPTPSLDGQTPLEVSRIAPGDVVSRARLDAMIAIREELGVRPSSIELYQGYPFDRLRKRLGLPVENAEIVDAIDEGCMSGPDLDALTLETLDGHALADAFRSAVALGDDARTSRFASAIVARRAATLARLDLEALFAPLIRHALAEDRRADAIEAIDQAIEVDQTFQDGRKTTVFETWRAELLSRVGEPDEAARVYQLLVDAAAAPEQVALDAAMTFQNDGHPGHARPFAELAIELAGLSGDVRVVRVAEGLLHQLDV
jgi:tetratricopeptide (TPR) repeat protein